MHKQRIFIAMASLLALTIVYLTSPLLAAYTLRQAVRSGDTETVQRMVVWPSLRASVKTTVATNAKLLPVAHQVARELRPTMWQRVRSVFGHSMLDRFVETYITPEGLPKLYRAKTRWHDRANSARQPDFVQASIIPDKLVRTWRRIKRAEFKGPFQFVLEMEDRHVATRLVESTFQLSNISFSGFDWKLTAIAIRNLKPGQARLGRLNGF